MNAKEKIIKLKTELASRRGSAEAKAQARERLFRAELMLDSNPAAAQGFIEAVEKQLAA